MAAFFLRCDKCQTILTGALVNAPEPAPCPSCGTPLLAQVFPAFFRPDPVGAGAEAVASDEEAGCFFHPRKKAAVPCEECGRFLCALCDLEIVGRHVCPSCLDAGRQQGRYPQFETQAVLHDQLALIVVLWPIITALLLGLFLWPFFFVVGPVVLFFTGMTALCLATRYWNEPGRRTVPRSRLKLILAALLGLAQSAGAVTSVYYVMQYVSGHRSIFLGR